MCAHIWSSGYICGELGDAHKTRSWSGLVFVANFIY